VTLGHTGRVLGKPKIGGARPDLRLCGHGISEELHDQSPWHVDAVRQHLAGLGTPGAFHPDAHFQDVDGEFVGYEELEGFSDSLQSRFPGARFTLTAVTSIGNAIRASLTFGPPERSDAVTGMDFVIVDGDKISQLYAFVERPGD